MNRIHAYVCFLLVSSTLFHAGFAKGGCGVKCSKLERLVSFYWNHPLVQQQTQDSDYSKCRSHYGHGSVCMLNRLLIGSNHCMSE